MLIKAGVVWAFDGRTAARQRNADAFCLHGQVLLLLLLMLCAGTRCCCCYCYVLVVLLLITAVCCLQSLP